MWLTPLDEIIDHGLKVLDPCAFLRKSIVGKTIGLLKFFDNLFKRSTCLFELGKIITSSCSEGKLCLAISLTSFLGGLVEGFPACLSFLRWVRRRLGLGRL